MTFPGPNSWGTAHACCSLRATFPLDSLVGSTAAFRGEAGSLKWRRWIRRWFLATEKNTSLHSTGWFHQDLIYYLLGLVKKKTEPTVFPNSGVATFRTIVASFSNWKPSLGRKLIIFFTWNLNIMFEKKTCFVTSCLEKKTTKPQNAPWDGNMYPAAISPCSCSHFSPDLL